MVLRSFLPSFLLSFFLFSPFTLVYYLHTSLSSSVRGLWADGDSQASHDSQASLSGHLRGNLYPLKTVSR